MSAPAPTWRDGLTGSALWVILTLGVCSILYLGREVLMPLALATLLGFALSPVVRALQKLGAPRALGAVVALALLMAALAVWVWFVGGQVSDLASQLPHYTHNIHDKIQGLVDKFGGGKGSGLAAAFEDMSREVAPSAQAVEQPPQRVVVVDNSTASRLSLLTSYASPVLSPLSTLLVVLVFTAFLLAQQEDLRNRLIKLIGPKDLYRTTEAIDDAGRRIGRMLFSQVLMNGTFGIVIAVALWLIGVPNPALFGAIAGIARFVPYIGVVFGLIPPLLVAFAFDPGWSIFLMTLGLFVIAESITGQLIEPIVYGHSSGLSPTAVVVATAIWAFLWGPIGLVLATPLTTVLVVLGRHVPRLAFLEILLGDEPPLTAEETFYQRMLAGDPRAAAHQARPYMQRDAIAEYYDEVALEALRRARLDVARGDLDDGRLHALTRSTSALVDALGAGKGQGWRAALRRWARFRRAAPAPQAGSARAVAVVHGDHPLDPLAAAMLAHALTRRGVPSRIVTRELAANASAEERAAVGLVCLTYIEPLTMAHLRAAAIAARRRCPQAKIMICVWRAPDDDSFRGLERKLRADAVATGVGMAGEAALRLLYHGAAPWVSAAKPPPRAKAA